MSNNKPDGAAYGSIGLSVAAIVLVTTLMPIIMGGSVALAIAFGEEVAGKQSPEDDNGYQWLEAGDCTRLGSGMNTPSTWQSKNWTTVGTPLTETMTHNCWTSTNDAVYTLRIPDQLVNQSESISRFEFTLVSTGYCNSCHQNWNIKYNLTVNGTEIFTGEEVNNRMYEIVNGNDHWLITFNHRLNGIEHLRLRSEVGNCDPFCDVRVNLFNITEGEVPGYDYANEPINSGKLKIETFTTDAATEGLIMTVSPYLLTFLSLLIALGSTRYWDPLKRWFE